MIVVSNQGASPGSVTHEDRLQSYVTLTGSVPFFLYLSHPIVKCLRYSKDGRTTTTQLLRFT